MATFFDVCRSHSEGNHMILEIEPVPRDNEVTLWRSDTDMVSSWRNDGATIYAQFDPMNRNKKGFWATTHKVDLVSFGFSPTQLVRAETFADVRNQLPEIVACDDCGGVSIFSKRHPAIKAYCGYPIRFWDLEIFETANDRVLVAECVHDITLFDVRTPSVPGDFFFAYPGKLDLLDFGFEHKGFD